MVADKINQQMKLRDGRMLGYAEYGSPQGEPVFFFHGWPSSRLMGQLIDEAARKQEVRLIAVDRPGIGLSDFKPGRQILDWPDDIIQLADFLKSDRFSVLGYSSGTAYAMACALRLSWCLKAAGIVSGLRPLGVRGATSGMPRDVRLFFLMARWAPWALRLFARQMMTRGVPDNPDHSPAGSPGSEEDKALSIKPDVGRVCGEALLEAFQSGNRGPAMDAILGSRSWGFDLREILVRVHLWHGEKDITVPPSSGSYLANTLLDCRARFVPGKGHISLITDHANEILADLIA